MSNQNLNDDDGLPDAAFTQDELDAGVQYIMRSGCAHAVELRDDSIVTDDEVPKQLIAPEDLYETLCFPTYAAAQAWAKANPGSAFSRAAEGLGFEAKVRSSVSAMPAGNSATSFVPLQDDRQRDPNVMFKRSAELRELSPHASQSFECWVNRYAQRFSHPFSDQIFENEIGNLSNYKRKRLLELLTQHLVDNQDYLRRIESRIRSDRRIKPGSHGENAFRAVNMRVEHAIDLLNGYMRRTGPTRRFQ